MGFDLYDNNIRIVLAVVEKRYQVFSGEVCWPQCGWWSDVRRQKNAVMKSMIRGE